MNGKSVFIQGVASRTTTFTVPPLAPRPRLLVRLGGDMSRHPAATATLLISLVVIVLLATYGLSAVAQSTVNGVVTGSHFALGAMGLTIIRSIPRLTNFAYGDYLTFGACVAVVCSQVLHAPIALPVVGAMAVVATYSVLGEVVLWRPLRERRVGATQLMIMSPGLAFETRYGIQPISDEARWTRYANASLLKVANRYASTSPRSER